MVKEKLISEAIKVWCDYGIAINKAFGFSDFYIEGEYLQSVITTNSENKIQSFIDYVKKRIVELEKFEN